MEVTCFLVHDMSFEKKVTDRKLEPAVKVRREQWQVIQITASVLKVLVSQLLLLLQSQHFDSFFLINVKMSRHSSGLRRFFTTYVFTQQLLHTGSGGPCEAEGVVVSGLVDAQ